MVSAAVGLSGFMFSVQLEELNVSVTFSALGDLVKKVATLLLESTIVASLGTIGNIWVVALLFSPKHGVLTQL
ncbi:hypothetical protein ELY33_15945 [Vreelandella andesensis]|uniref:Uncharacterized protein n=1 Tax=Vreelandella andesensis TaxID=447567 RepID=A0A3S0YR45_9GAMM|nr:hypothetical protein [Halomonas andesensis]RUR27388.1 hypothetical protein ELY33_15945 [Halomonas andesensis]